MKNRLARDVVWLAAVKSREEAVSCPSCRIRDPALEWIEILGHSFLDEPTPMRLERHIAARRSRLFEGLRSAWSDVVGW